jgi:hypothetical protein
MAMLRRRRSDLQSSRRRIAVPLQYPTHHPSPSKRPNVERNKARCVARSVAPGHPPNCRRELGRLNYQKNQRMAARSVGPRHEVVVNMAQDARVGNAHFPFVRIRLTKPSVLLACWDAMRSSHSDRPVICLGAWAVKAQVSANHRLAMAVITTPSP